MVRPFLPLALCGLFLVACGKPVDEAGRADTRFTKASMTPETLVAPDTSDVNRTLASEVGVQLVAMTVVFDRLHTPELLQTKLNHTPGRLSRVDLDKDGTPDPLTVTMADVDGDHQVEIRSRTAIGEFVIITMMFDAEWQFTGYFDGRKDGPTSTYANPLPAPA